MRNRILAALTATAAVAATLVAGLATPAEAALPAPYTSPGVTRILTEDAAAADCSSGYLCAWVQSNTHPYSQWYLFKFTKCGVYTLNYWHDYSVIGGASIVVDDQTGNVLTTYYGKSNNVLQTMRPKKGDFQNVMIGKDGWNPVYKIRVC